MVLPPELQNRLRGERGVCAAEACDRCGQILGAVRFTRAGDSGVWCSRECRGDGDRRTICKGGRPRKYKTENDRLRVERRQNAERQKAFRGRVQRNGKPPASFAETTQTRCRQTSMSGMPWGITLARPQNGTPREILF